MKLKALESIRLYANVAPHAGAWIETAISTLFAVMSAVAPHAGAWIETSN